MRVVATGERGYQTPLHVINCRGSDRQAEHTALIGGNCERLGLEMVRNGAISESVDIKA